MEKERILELIKDIRLDIDADIEPMDGPGSLAIAVENYSLDGQYVTVDKLIEALKTEPEEDRDLAAIENEPTAQDKVNHPKHYTWLKSVCGVEVIDITRHLDFDLGNAIKYILRAGHKSEEGYNDKEKEIEDLKKAVFYINDKIKFLSNAIKIGKI